MIKITLINVDKGAEKMGTYVCVLEMTGVCAMSRAAFVSDFFFPTAHKKFFAGSVF